MNASTHAPGSVSIQRHTWLLVATLLVQLALLALAFPFPGWEPGQGLFHIDHPFHLYQVTLGRALLEHGSLIGYDPFFGAGNVGGVTFNVSAKLPVLISSLLPASVSSVTLYLSYVFLCALLAPVALAGVGQLLRWPVIQTAALALLGTLFWWIGAFHWYHSAGMASFVCACYTSILYSVWVFRVLDAQHGRWPYAQIAATGVLGGLGLWLHPLFGVLAAAMISGLLIAHCKTLKLAPALGRAAAIGLLALLLNVPWILAMKADANLLQQEHVHQIDVGFRFLGDAMIGRWGRSMGSPLNPLVLSLALLAIALVRPAGRRDLIAFFATGCTLLVFAAFGASINILAGLQPNRFLGPGFLLIGIAASYAIPDGLAWLQARKKRAMSMIILSLALLTAAVLGRELVREVIPGTHGHYGKAPPEVSDPAESVAWLASWIKENTSSEGRILFETSLARVHGGGHIAGYLALQTKREFIGAPYPFLMPERSFWDQRGFAHPLAELTPEQLLTGLELYNVGWIISHSEALTQLVEKMPQSRLLAQQGELHIFAIDQPLSYFQSGNGRVVERNFDHIAVDTTPGSKLVLRYQWVKGLVTTPATKIEAISLSADFPPFIQITDAPAHFRIHLQR